jgi:hypothetical protein
VCVSFLIPLTLLVRFTQHTHAGRRQQTVAVNDATKPRDGSLQKQHRRLKSGRKRTTITLFQAHNFITKDIFITYRCTLNSSQVQECNSLTTMATYTIYRLPNDSPKLDRTVSDYTILPNKLFLSRMYNKTDTSSFLLLLVDHPCSQFVLIYLCRKSAWGEIG